MGGGLGNNYIFDTQPSNDGQLHHAIVNATPAGWKFFTDGKLAPKLGSLSGANRGQWFGHLPAIQHLTLGQHTDGTGEAQGSGHQGKFAAILIYDHPLNKTERAAVNEYVEDRFQAGKSTTVLALKGLRFWLDAGDIDGNPATANPKTGTPVEEWTDKISSITLGQTNAKLQPKLSTLGKSGAVAFDNSFLRGEGQRATFARDKQGAMVVIFSATHQGEGYGFEVGGGKAFISTVSYPEAGAKTSLETALKDANHPVFTAEDRACYHQLKNAETFIKQRLKRLEPVAMSLRHSYGPPYEPGVPVTRIKIRGEYDNPGEPVRAGFPSVITGHQEPALIRLDPFKRWPTRSRRMALAR
jgi:hypothetical protein